ncbi:acyltransferase family protein [Sediminitomix flava]|uniref:Putative acyltransferase n=1 Tax=Sediminitomix flava TaxID=379075 RepID=A0A315ZJL1_SEDFL|nr:heparan-alpha-glucosaminide N-acetyltransferase domain-containing protein [Sediminitomix flava]PWJ45018.1 putative acyltransferase [Sediminitomix flava]
MKESDRVLSLDVLRGATVAFMIMVNNPGSWSTIYAPLKHAAWHGCTPTDLVFPFFLFIVGVSIGFSMYSARSKKERHPQLIKKIISRSLKLIGIGLFLAAFPYFELTTLRFPGVLQRIGIVFFFCAILFLKVDWQGLCAIIITVLLGYWGMMTLIPIPEIGAPNLDDPSMTLSAWLDRLVLGNHLWSGTKTWDPEGILSTIPAIGTGLLGVLAGIWFKQPIVGQKKVAGSLIFGIIICALGWGWGYLFPINKGLWSSSFVLYTAGWASIGLSLSYWLLDVQKRGRNLVLPFKVFGLNPMAVYFLSGIVARLVVIKGAIGDQSLKSWAYENIYLSTLSPLNASLAYAVTFISLMYLVAWWLYKKNIVIKV